MTFTIINDDTEMWLDIEHYEGKYSISSLGRVYSHKGKTRILKATPDKKGYLTVGLSRDGIKKTMYIHALVGNAFVGKRVNGLSFDHIDINKQNNRADNLRLATRSEQQINQNLQKNNKTGEKNISVNRNIYDINIIRNNKIVFRKYYLRDEYTLEDCARIRDEFLQTLT